MNLVRSGTTRFKCFPGATTAKLNYYLVPELREIKYTTAMIPVATNDIFDKTEEEIVRELGEISLTCMNHGVERIIFSRVIRRRTRRNYIKEKRCYINSLLEGMCSRGWKTDKGILTDFVCNDNILEVDLDHGGLHLEESGSIKLANNILMCINGH